MHNHVYETIPTWEVIIAPILLFLLIGCIVLEYSRSIGIPNNQAPVYEDEVLTVNAPAEETTETTKNGHVEPMYKHVVGQSAKIDTLIFQKHLQSPSFSIRDIWIMHSLEDVSHSVKDLNETVKY